MTQFLKLAAFFSQLREDARGTIVVQFAVYMIAMMGFIGLALDGAVVFFCIMIYKIWQMLLHLLEVRRWMAQLMR